MRCMTKNKLLILFVFLSSCTYQVNTFEDKNIETLNQEVEQVRQKKKIFEIKWNIRDEKV